MNLSLRSLGLSLLLGATAAGGQQAPSPSVPQTTLPTYAPVPGNLSGHLRSIGTDTMKTLLTDWIAGFTALSAISIDAESKGALTAAPALIDGVADIAPLSREMVPSEIDRFVAKYGYPPTAIRVGMGSYATSGHTVALAFFVNAANPLVHIDFTQLDAIYCTTHLRGGSNDITKWGQLGLTGEWANRDIHLVGVKVPDGISNFIRLRVCGGGAFRPGIHEENTGGTVNVLDRIVSLVAADPAAIGYAGFLNLKPGTKQLDLAEASTGPFLHGTPAEVASAAYPLSRYIYVFLNRPPGKPIDPLTKQFLLYILSRDGQQAIVREGISLPLPPAVVQTERNALN